MSDIVNFERGQGIHYHGHRDENGDPVFWYADVKTDRCPYCPPPGTGATATVTSVDYDAGTLTVSR